MNNGQLSKEDEEFVNRAKEMEAHIRPVVDDGSEAVRHLQNKQAGAIGSFDGRGVTKEQLDEFLRSTAPGSSVSTNGED